MRIPSHMYPTITGAAVAAAALACGPQRFRSVEPSVPGTASSERKPVRSAALDVSVDTAAKAAREVTEQYTDLEARLRTSIALRDRLLHLLGRADGVSDVLTVERELSRVQPDIESMQSRLEQLKSQVELAALSVTLHRKHKLGPLSYVGYGIWRGFSQLFVIR